MSDADTEFYVGVENRGTRLDHFLTEKLSHLSRSRIQALCKEGHILLDGVPPPKPGMVLRGTEHIVCHEPAPKAVETLAEDIPLSVLYEDEHLIVVDKPAGMVVHPAVGNPDGTLVNALLHHCDDLSGIGGEERPGIVHRLDKDTSGCMIIAKSDIAHHGLAEQFQSRSLEKTYLAIVAGRPRMLSGSVRAPIARHHLHRQRMTVVEPGKGKEAHTDWKCLASWKRPGTEMSLIECRLHTGRTHQIRVHLKHIGLALAGDAVYGKPLDLPRQMLHAWRIGFRHPVTGGAMRFTAPIPSDFVGAIPASSMPSGLRAD